MTTVRKHTVALIVAEIQGKKIALHKTPISELDNSFLNQTILLRFKNGEEKGILHSIREKEIVINNGKSIVAYPIENIVELFIDKKMPIQITKLTDKGFLVNGKAVYMDEQGIWIPEVKFDYVEITEFKKHLNAIQKEVKVEFKNLE
ncbi:hypothetical protein [Chishuiella changwenlii]|uniref:hypothetical protein n=1 Tax=Chishuiella changwenlii TaxID=1434701 RepID=UPI002FD8D604